MGMLPWEVLNRPSKTGHENIEMLNVQACYSATTEKSLERCRVQRVKQKSNVQTRSTKHSIVFISMPTGHWHLWFVLWCLWRVSGHACTLRAKGGVKRSNFRHGMDRGVMVHEMQYRAEFCHRRRRGGRGRRPGAVSLVYMLIR